MSVGTHSCGSMSGWHKKFYAWDNGEKVILHILLILVMGGEKKMRVKTTLFVEVKKYRGCIHRLIEVEVVLQVPSDYARILGPHLHHVAQLTTKWFGVRNQLAKLQAHVTAGTFPSSYPHMPSLVQLTSEFRASSGPQFDVEKDAINKAAFEAALALDVKAKEAELKKFEELLTPKALDDEMKEAIQSRYEELLERNKTPKFRDVYVNLTGPAGGTRHEVEVIEGEWDESPLVFETYRNLREDVFPYRTRVSILTEQGLFEQKAKAEAKRKVAKAVDEVMGDGPVITSTLKSSVDAAVAVAVKKLSKGVPEKLAKVVDEDEDWQDLVFQEPPFKARFLIPSPAEASGSSPRHCGTWTGLNHDARIQSPDGVIQHSGRYERYPTREYHWEERTWTWEEVVVQPPPTDFSTDKNLGIAVSQRSWIIEKSLDILSNPLDYKQLHPLELQAILDGQQTEMGAIADYALSHDPIYGEQLYKWRKAQYTRILRHS
ncbi:hypothetical protein BD779DRAFT_1474689 [Infundibulicybe gibba]|nr:hypothetical protein BD779DRAFT_1474689 [Infundibulicybe gibba]